MPYIGAPARGDYTVTAQVGDKGVPGTTHFTVESSAIDIDEDVADNQKFLDESKDLTKKVKTAVDNTPDLPLRKPQMESKLGTLETKLDQVSQQSAQLTSMLAPVKTSAGATSRSPIRVAADARVTLHRLDQQARERGDAVVTRRLQTCRRRSRPAIRSIRRSRPCRRCPTYWTWWARPFEFVSAYVADMAKAQLPAESGAAVDAAAKAADLANATQHAGSEEAEKVQESMLDTAGIRPKTNRLGSETAIANKLVEAIPESMRKSDGYKLAVTEIKKLAPRVIGDATNPIKLFDDAAALTTDIASYGEKNYFARYCEKFEGPFTATMAAYFYAKDHPDHDWWHYTIAIKGTLSLRYPKDAGGGSVPLSGEFKGGATKFTYNESVWKDSDLFKLVKGGPGRHQGHRADCDRSRQRRRIEFAALAHLVLHSGQRPLRQRQSGFQARRRARRFRPDLHPQPHLLRGDLAAHVDAAGDERFHPALPRTRISCWVTSHSITRLCSPAIRCRWRRMRRRRFRDCPATRPTTPSI